jgi:hypothetical protein
MTDKKLCVWVREVAVLNATGAVFSHWEVWSAHNTLSEARQDERKDFISRPKWVTANFHRRTNRIRKYVPA